MGVTIKVHLLEIDNRSRHVHVKAHKRDGAIFARIADIREKFNSKYANGDVKVEPLHQFYLVGGRETPLKDYEGTFACEDTNTLTTNIFVFPCTSAVPMLHWWWRLVDIINTIFSLLFSNSMSSLRFLFCKNRILDNEITQKKYLRKYYTSAQRSYQYKKPYYTTVQRKYQSKKPNYN